MCDVASRTGWHCRGVITALAAAAVLLGASMAMAATPTSDRLSPARFAAFDAVKTAFLPFEHGASSAEVANARRVCDTLDRSDRLQAIWRSGCHTTLALDRASRRLDACQTPRSCSRAAGQLRATFGRLVVEDRLLNRILRGELAPGPCLGDLRVGRAGIRSGEQIRDALRRLQHALRTNSPSAIRRAQHRLDVASRSGAAGPTSTQKRASFRRDCNPAT